MSNWPDKNFITGKESNQTFFCASPNSGVYSKVLKFSLTCQNWQEQISPVLQEKFTLPSSYTVMYHHFVKCILEVLCDKVSLAPPFLLKLSHLLLLHIYITQNAFQQVVWASCLQSQRGLWENKYTVVHKLTMLVCVCSLALAQNANCLVAALHSGPVGLLWVLFFFCDWFLPLWLLNVSPKWWV